MEMGLRQRLLDDAAVAAIASSRVAWGVRPERTGYPAVVLETVDARRTQTHDGFNTFQPTAVQVNCFAAKQKTAAALRDAVIAAIAPEATVDGTRFLRAQNIRHLSRPENTERGFVFREIVEATIWHD